MTFFTGFGAKMKLISTCQIWQPDTSVAHEQHPFASLQSEKIGAAQLGGWAHVLGGWARAFTTRVPVRDSDEHRHVGAPQQ